MSACAVHNRGVLAILTCSSSKHCEIVIRSLMAINIVYSKTNSHIHTWTHGQMDGRTLPSALSPCFTKVYAIHNKSLRPPGGSIIEITPLFNKAVSLLYCISGFDISSSKKICNNPDYIDGMLMYEYIAILIVLSAVSEGGSVGLDYHPIKII